MANVFKKFYETLAEKLQFDIKIGKSGISFDVGLKGDSENEKPRAFAVAINGLHNPIGGVLITILENSNSDKDTFTIPKVTNKANLFLFLNGKLIPDNASSRTTLAEYVLKDGVNSTIHDMDKLYLGEVDISLNDGYKIGYIYIPPHTIKKYMPSGTDIKTLLDIFSDALIVTLRDETLVTVDPYSDGSESDWSLEQRKLTTDLTKVLCGHRSDKKTYQCEEDTISLVDALSEYVYSNILREIEKEIKDIAKTTNLHDIPWTNESLEQTKWLAKLKKSVKDEKSWEQIQAMFVVDWN